jgi:hypothetical protein
MSGTIPIAVFAMPMKRPPQRAGADAELQRKMAKCCSLSS